MSVDNKYQTFLRHYLARGAVGVSVGLAAVTPAPAAATTEPASHEQATRSFADRLGMVRSAATKLAEDSEILLAQGITRPPPGEVFRPPPAERPFDNWGKAAFEDAWKNFANVPQPK
jgi:hypothetical protein